MDAIREGLARSTATPPATPPGFFPVRKTLAQHPDPTNVPSRSRADPSWCVRIATALPALSHDSRIAISLIPVHPRIWVSLLASESRSRNAARTPPPDCPTGGSDERRKWLPCADMPVAPAPRDFRQALTARYSACGGSSRLAEVLHDDLRTLPPAATSCLDASAKLTI